MYRQAAAFESGVDLEVPTGLNGMVWRWGRTYFSNDYDYEHDNHYVSPHWRIGNKWRLDSYTPRLFQKSDFYWNGIDGEYFVAFGAGSSIAFKAVPGLTDTWRSPQVLMTLVRKIEGELDEYDYFELTDDTTGEVFVFWGFNSPTGTDMGYVYGLLREYTTVGYQEESKTGIQYLYTAGKLSSIILPTQAGLDAYQVTFDPVSYDANRLGTVTVWNGEAGSSEAIAKVEYRYHDGDADGAYLGTENDLLQVKISRKASGETGSAFSIVRTSQYRYFGYGEIKAVYEADAIERITAANDSNVETPAKILTKTDEYAVASGQPLKEYANRSFTYYTENVPTDDIDTDFGTVNENLNQRYGGIEVPEEANSKVKSETIRGACGSCGSSSTGFTRKYYYLYPTGEPGTGVSHLLYYKYIGTYAGYPFYPLSNVNQVTFLVIEDTVSNDGSKKYRKVYGVNDQGYVLREALINDPADSSAWCRSTVYGSVGGIGNHRVLEERYSSAHNVSLNPTDSNSIVKFLVPYDSYATLTWANDTATLHNEAGVIHVHSYDSNGYQSALRVKQGRRGDTDPTTTPADNTSNLFYLSAADWSNHSSGVRSRFLLDAEYVYPTKSQTRSTGVKTDYLYTFWASTYDTVVKTQAVKAPAVDTTQNGPGTTDSYRALHERYFDKAGRLRWTKDGEGYVNYYSYHPLTGGLAYQAIDINNPASPGSDVVNGSAGKWIASSVDGAESNYPTRTGMPTGLGLVTKTEFDAQARPVLTIDPLGTKHFTLYQDNRTLRFPAWNTTSNLPLTPIEVTEVNDGDAVTASYEIDPARTVQTGGAPTGLSSGTDQSHYVGLTRHQYHGVNGQRIRTDRYFDIPSSGGTAFTHFYPTHYLYDGEGRVGATAEGVESGKYQVDAIVYDVLGRPASKRRALVSAFPLTYSIAVSATTLLSSITYDGGDVGDGHVTYTRTYHTASLYTDTFFHRTFRGFLRGVNRQYSASPTEIKPHQVMDVDWLGRTVERCVRETAPTWSTLTSGEGDSSVVPSLTDRIDRITTKYDVLGRVYRSEHYPGTSVTNKLQTNNYYDRNGRLVYTGDKYSAHTEYAYDGAGRQYQERIVKDVGSTKYVSGVFQYRKPLPLPVLSTMISTSTAGDEGVIEITHNDLDAAGNAIGEHTFELNHSDSDGIDLDAASGSSYLRHTIYKWYDPADRLSGEQDYGAGNGGATNTWAYSTVPTRNSSPTNWSSSVVRNGYARRTSYSYNVAGRLETVDQGVSTDGSDVTRQLTKTFYDDLGRRIYVAENYVDFAIGSPNPTGVGGGANNDQDRVTGWIYNGLDQVTDLKAYTSNSTAQLTKYLYGDSYEARLVTETIYPDSTDTTSSGNDQIKRTYNLDGSLATQTDQRGVVHTYAYNNRRQLELDGVSGVTGTFPSTVDGTVLSIKRIYDDRGRLTNVYSYAAANGSGTVLNQVAYDFWDSSDSNHGKIFNSYQYHDASSFQVVAYRWDAGVTSNVFHNAIRQWVQVAPNGARVYFEYGHSNPQETAENLHDRLGRITGLQFDPDGIGTTYPSVTQTAYDYNGVSRLVSANYVAALVRRRMYNATTNTNYDAFDRWGRTVRHQWDKYVVSPASSTPIDQFNYANDLVGNRLSRDIPSGLYASNNRDETYAYDGLLRLSQANDGTYSSGMIADVSAKFRQKWTLDALGNWSTFQQDGLLNYSTIADNDFVDSTDVDQDRTHNAVNEITDTVENVGVAWTNTIGYDDAGNMTEFAKPLSPGGKPYVATYDAWNRLVKLTLDGDNVAAFEYDGLNRRIVKTVYDGTGTFDYYVHYYYNEAWQVVEERIEEDMSPAVVSAQYVWHPQYVDALAVRYWDSGGSPGPDAYHYYLQDANYNVTAVTNDAGAVVERYAYTPYGVPTILNGASDADGAVADFSADANGISDIGNNYLYTGRERDPETGLQNSRYRFYASHLGRFLKRDPIGYASGLNLYLYTSADPVSSKDPFGLHDAPIRWPVDDYPYLPPGPLRDPWFIWPWEDQEQPVNRVEEGCVGLACERVDPSLKRPMHAPGIECFDTMGPALERLSEMQDSECNTPCLFAFQSMAAPTPAPGCGPDRVEPIHPGSETSFDYITLHCPEKRVGLCNVKDCWWERMNHGFTDPDPEVIVGPYPTPKKRTDIFCVVPNCKTPTAGGLGPMPVPPPPPIRPRPLPY